MDLPKITSTSLLDAIKKALVKEASEADHNMIEHALEDQDWVLFVQDCLRPKDYERMYSDSFDMLGPKLQQTLETKPKLVDWKVPGVFAIYVYNQVFGWSGHLPVSKDSREMLLKVYSDVAPAFARLDGMQISDSMCLNR